MKKNEFKLIKCHCDGQRGVLVIILKEHKNYEPNYVGKNIIYDKDVYRVSIEQWVVDNMILLICYKVCEIAVQDFEYLFKYNVKNRDDYFIDDIKKIIKKD